ncbi:MAG TPA: zf-HC2 domain-containing protein, partial [Vicinamibacteria bacterium]|nr:zf-HC2 domain-containing protein [Vicinamibacteria bacterium]
MSGHERERLSAYLDRELPPDERLMVEAHLAGCAGCTALLAELAAADEAAAALPAEAPAGYFESFPARVRSRLGPRKAQAPARRLPAWTWAAAAGLLLAIVVPLTLRQLPPTAR